MPAVGLPLNADSGESGRKVPANGPVPAEMGMAAESSKTVGVPPQEFAPLPKLSSPPPRRFDSTATVPSGPTRETWRSPSKVWLSRTRTLMSATAPASGMKMGTSATPRSGIGTETLPLLAVIVCAIGLSAPSVNV
jgi:hypothetical protein